MYIYNNLYCCGSTECIQGKLDSILILTRSCKEEIRPGAPEKKKLTSLQKQTKPTCVCPSAQPWTNICTHARTQPNYLRWLWAAEMIRKPDTVSNLSAPPGRLNFCPISHTSGRCAVRPRPNPKIFISSSASLNNFGAGGKRGGRGKTPPHHPPPLLFNRHYERFRGQQSISQNGSYSRPLMGNTNFPQRQNLMLIHR